QNQGLANTWNRFVERARGHWILMFRGHHDSLATRRATQTRITIEPFELFLGGNSATNRMYDPAFIRQSWPYVFFSLGEALQPNAPLQPPPANGILPDCEKD